MHRIWVAVVAGIVWVLIGIQEKVRFACKLASGAFVKLHPLEVGADHFIKARASCCHGGEGKDLHEALLSEMDVEAARKKVFRKFEAWRIH